MPSQKAAQVGPKHRLLHATERIFVPISHKTPSFGEATLEIGLGPPEGHGCFYSGQAGEDEPAMEVPRVTCQG